MNFIFSMFLLSLGVIRPAVASVASAQEPLKDSAQVFQRFDLGLKGRLRHLTLENLFPGGGKEIAVLEREGDYPDWKLKLSVWSVKSPKEKLSLRAEAALPSDTIFYGFVPSGNSRPARLLLVRPHAVELWPAWDGSSKFTLPVDGAFPAAQPGQAEPFDPVSPVSRDRDSPLLLVPVKDGYLSIRASDRGLSAVSTYALPPKAFYKSSAESLPFELPFWLRGSLWYPAPHAGGLKHPAAGDLLLFPWMDEVEIRPVSGPEPVRTLRFRQFTEAERDDAQSYAVTIPVDLNGDGRTDFIVNKFQGEATSLRAETALFITGPDGAVPETGLVLKPQGNRAAGALPVDLNRDGKMDLAAASSQFSVWSVVQAFLQRRIDINFAFYMNHGGGYLLDKPDFEREISFKFDLADLAIEGMLPTLEGDFNGDGYPDALYARDRRALTVLLQHPGAAKPFPSVPSGRYEISVPRSMRVGDLDGDGKSDVVLYERRSVGNRRISVLLNTGVLK